ncbi:MAG TPA: bifunctional alpha,alpha-trehalose-phosphate synthase (UDP-forming)/trehalose-phosphatase [Bacteroides sp.]|nr:bifunctional alpha,alpha-trehalose-phosphate synthase (UDP-forming)/trehalose-phosphatase [Bacteroides sp.]
MNRLLIVSNRLPVSVAQSKDGIKVTPSVGGLATGMKSIYKNMESTWIGWPGIDRSTLSGKDEARVTEQLEEEHCRALYIDKKDMDAYYYGFSNKTIWPLFHYFPQYTVYDRDYWETYRKVNRMFADKIMEMIKKDDHIWIHDYHLLLLPNMIKEAHPETTIGFFNHIPFPSYELFRLLPWREEILAGMLGADLIGFHSYDYQRHFSSCVRRLFGYDYELNQFNLGHRIIRVDSFPMGIDYEKYSSAAGKIKKHGGHKKPKLQEDIERFHQLISGRKLILSIDRMDYSKGIPNRLHAFRRFLEKYPDYHGKVSLVMLTVPSRSKVDQYRLLKREVDELVGKINGTYGDLNWTPVWYFYRSMSFENLILLYHYADIGLITPLRDGMNLVAKEFIATKTAGTGVLILSEMAGSAKEMSEAILINPNNREEMAEAIRAAIEMPVKEQKERNQQIQKRLKRYTVQKWAREFMDGMQEVNTLQQKYSSKKMNAQVTGSILDRFSRSEKRILFLDYNGTLVTSKKAREYAEPDRELYELLDRLVDRSIDIVLMSSRDQQTMEKWFGDREVMLFAEHGMWKKTGDGGWQQTSKPLSSLWKESIRPAMETYVDRTPGSYLEEMNNVLSWHYEKADPDHGIIRARDLKDELTARIINMELQIVEGRDVIEIKPSGMNKGIAALDAIAGRNYDFIMAVGDDWTDETMFELLPVDAITLRVGMKKTQAKYNCESYRDVRKLLKRMSEDPLTRNDK